MAPLPLNFLSPAQFSNLGRARTCKRLRSPLPFPMQVVVGLGAPAAGLGPSVALCKQQPAIGPIVRGVSKLDCSTPGSREPTRVQLVRLAHTTHAHSGTDCRRLHRLGLCIPRG